MLLGCLHKFSVKKVTHPVFCQHIENTYMLKGEDVLIYQNLPSFSRTGEKVILIVPLKLNYVRV